MNILNLHNITAVALMAVGSYLIPFLTSLISKQHWSGATLGLVTTALSALAGFVAEWASSPNIDRFDWKAGIALALTSFLIAGHTRSTVLKGTPLDAKLLAIGSTTGQHEVAA